MLLYVIVTLYAIVINLSNKILSQFVLVVLRFNLAKPTILHKQYNMKFFKKSPPSPSKPINHMILSLFKKKPK